MRTKNIEFYKTLGRNLKTARHRAGISQQVAGECVGVTFQQIQKYENGNNRISSDKAVALALLYKTDINTLIGATPAVMVQRKPWFNSIKEFEKLNPRARRLVGLLIKELLTKE